MSAFGVAVPMEVHRATPGGPTGLLTMRGAFWRGGAALLPVPSAVARLGSSVMDLGCRLSCFALWRAAPWRSLLAVSLAMCASCVLRCWFIQVHVVGPVGGLVVFREAHLLHGDIPAAVPVDWQAQWDAAIVW